MRKYLSGLFALLLPVMLHAQVTIHGTVTDQQSGAAVVRATVTIPGTSMSTLTDSSGAFSLSSPTSVSHISVSRFGYTAKDIPLNGGSETLAIKLTPIATVLPGMVVVANKPEPSTAVLTKPDLDRGNGINLESSLNAVPGLFMQSRAPFGGARVTIRGYYPSSSGKSANFNGLGYQVFLNDIPITDATGSTILDDIDYSTLGSVRVIKGPASSEYGGFIGGALRLETARPPIGQTSISQQALSGTDGLLRTNTSIQTANDVYDLTINYGHQRYNSFRPHSASRKDYWRASGDFQVGEKQTLGVYFGYNKSFEELAGEMDTVDFYHRIPSSSPGYLANDSHTAITSVLTGVSDHFQISDHFSNRTAVFGSGRFSNAPYAHGFTDINQFNFGVRSVFGYAAQLSSGVGVNGSLGTTMQRSQLTSNGVFIVPAPPYPENPTAQQNYAENASVFTQWGLSLPHEVSVTVGGGINKNTFSIQNMLKNGKLFDTTTATKRSFDWVFTPQISVSKGIGQGATVYASVGSGYTPPQLTDAVASDGSVNLNLKPEHGVQYEVGTQGSFLNNRLSASVAVFDLENTDKLVTAKQNLVTYTTNAGKQRNRGFEASLSLLALNDPSKLLATLRPWLSYSYTEAKFVSFLSDANNNANTKDFSGKLVPRVPKNMVSAGLDGTIRDGFSFNVTYQSVSKVPITFDNSLSVKGYGLLGARIGYERMVVKHWKLNVYGGGTNLTNATSYAFLFVGPTASSLNDGYVIPAPYKANLYGNATLSYVF